MECRDALEASVHRLAGELKQREMDELDRHLAACPACRTEAETMISAWSNLEDGTDDTPSPWFRARTLALLSKETARRRERGRLLTFRPRVFPILAQAAALVAAAGAGFYASRLAHTDHPTPTAVPLTPVAFSVVPQRTLDVAKTMPDLSSRPRLANVSYAPADAAGRIGVSFDVTTRYTLVGRPEEKGIANVLAYLLAGAADTEGARGQAIDLVTRHYGEAGSVSPEIAGVLAETLKKDKNPGVRRKAAEALVQLPPTKEAQGAFIDALKSDTNPAVRILAVEGLAKASRALKDPASIESLREKASDQKESGYVRSQAALALKGLQL